MQRTILLVEKFANHRVQPTRDGGWGWRWLAWFGLVLALMGLRDFVLPWYPLAFGRPKWEVRNRGRDLFRPAVDPARLRGLGGSGTGPEQAVADFDDGDGAIDVWARTPRCLRLVPARHSCHPAHRVPSCPLRHCEDDCQDFSSGHRISSRVLPGSEGFGPRYAKEGPRLSRDSTVEVGERAI